MIAVRGNSDEKPVLHAESVTKQLAAADHILNALRKIKSDRLQIKEELAMPVQSQSLRTIFPNGKGGVDIRDRISEGTEELLDSFEELLRSLLLKVIGPRAMLARAAEGVQQRRLVFALPADRQAIDIALQKIVLPQLKDLVTRLGHGR